VPWAKGQSGNPKGPGLGPKPYRNAMRLEVAALDAGNKTNPPRGSLRDIVKRQLMRARSSDIAAKEVADRLDGKAVQAIASDDENPPMQIVEVRLVMVDDRGQPVLIEQPKPLIEATNAKQQAKSSARRK
jgi:hypothetical protein